MVAIPVVTGIAAYYAAEEFHKGFFIEAGYYAQQLAENVHNHVEKEFLRPLREQGSYVDLLNDPGQLRKIEEIVEISTHSHQVEKLYFFEPDGTISFSTVRDHIGQSMPPGNPHFLSALAGHTESVVRSRDNPLDISETTPGIELLETYVPVYSTDPQGVRRLSGVVEVYQKMSKLRDSVNRVRRHTALVALLSMGF